MGERIEGEQLMQYAVATKEGCFAGAVFADKERDRTQSGALLALEAAHIG